ncbi:MAG: hypothetical protein L0Z50_12915, partial [Verrucomicrobiales bacterium]|nr:hypothetical protein [Verrucomicrobiales bacterium]
MTILPLVEREVRIATRRPHAYRIRLGIATGAMVIAVWGLWAWSSWIAGAFVGHSLFRTLAGIAFVGSLGAGVLLTADGLSQERREGTLGLLFLTDLRPADIVFGKLAAKALLPFYGLLALLPALSVFTVVGGVTGGELCRTMLALANTLFVSLSVALFTSMLCTEQRLAHALAFLAIAALAGGSLVLGGLPNTRSAAIFKALAHSFSLTATFEFAEEKQFRAASALFQRSLVGSHLVGWISLFLTCWGLPAAWKERKSAHTSVSLAFWLGRLGLPASSARARARMLDLNPLTWLGERLRLRALAVWALPLFALLSWYGLSLATSGPVRFAAALLWAGGVHVAARLWIAMDASHAFGASRRDGTLESLLGTPLSSSEIASGMVVALRHRFLGPTLTVALISLGAALKLFFAGESLAAAALVLAAATLALDISCISWIGLWRGLSAKGSTAAILWTTACTICLPAAWFMLLRGLFEHSPPAEFLGPFLVMSVANNLLFRASARTRLDEHFRTLALRP